MSNSALNGKLDKKLENEFLQMGARRTREFGKSYLYRIGKLSLLTETNLFCELVVEPRIYPLPNSPSHFAGLLNSRGNLIPVYELEPLQNEPVQELHNFAFLLGKYPNTAGILVNQIPSSVDIDDLIPIHNHNTIELPHFLDGTVIQVYRDRENNTNWLSIDHALLFKRLSKMV